MGISVCCGTIKLSADNYVQAYLLMQVRRILNIGICTVRHYHIIHLMIHNYPLTNLKLFNLVTANLIEN